jgi:hypothetical protein
VLEPPESRQDGLPTLNARKHVSENKGKGPRSCDIINEDKIAMSSLFALSILPSPSCKDHANESHWLLQVGESSDIT